MIFACFAKAEEPIYAGKALSEWLVELHRSPSPEEVFHAETNQPANVASIDDLFTQKQTRDANAIKQIGTNALPILLDMLGATQKNSKRVVSQLQSPELREWYSRDEAHIEDLRSLAVDGLSILGTNAEPAIPRISALFRSFSEPSFQAARALTKVGPKGFEALTNAVNDSPENVRNNLIWALGEEGSGDSNAIARILIVLLKDTSAANRGNAARFLANRNPALVIPALIPLLDDKNFLVIEGAASALGSYGRDAKDAAPKLFAIFTNSIVQPDRQQAKIWGSTLMPVLNAIDVGMAAKAEDFLIHSSPLNYARFAYTTTALKNGKELVVGGYIHTEFPTATNSYLSETELYVPSSGKCTEAEPLNEARFSHTATLMKDGRVLVVGGSSGNGHALASAEIYDPKTDKWAQTGALNIARYYHKATIQPDGKVLVEGGDTEKSQQSKELYDPGTGTWSLLIPK